MQRNSRRTHKKQAGGALLAVLGTLTILTVVGTAFINAATGAMRSTTRSTYTVQSFHLCEAGIQEVLLSLWQPFKETQTFTDMDGRCAGAATSNPAASVNDSIPGVGMFSVGVISYTNVDSYTRQVIVRCVGWIDKNGNGVLDKSEPRRIVDVNATFKLTRSQVFDYTYFVNNYGWMDGFGPNDLVVNGDMRANGNFAFTNGSPTVNGSVYASNNDKLIPAAAGLISGTPVKWDDNTYNTQAGSQSRWRQGYSVGVHGAKTSSTYTQWAPFIFDSVGSVLNQQLDGSTLSDSGGSKAWTNDGTTTPTSTLLDSSSTQEVIMPDLSNITYYQTQSQTYSDTKATYGDGTANPFYNQGAYLNVWNPALNGGHGAYQTVTTKGVITGSASAVGTQAHPIQIHGPVTVTQDFVVKGYVSGQGTVYTGRNIHVVGSIFYSNAPDFRGGNMQSIDNSNEKKDALGLAARASIIMGDTAGFSNPYPLYYMQPPFTHDRYDDNGNLVPAYNATQTDSTGFMKYQSVMGDTYIHSLAEPINQIDAIMYTNFVGGGDIGTGGAGITLNGTIISKDEAMVTWSLPMRENYDNRIKERTLNNKPLIDLQLPRSPVMLTSTWQDQGFSMEGH
jgi:hypothetical protein